jgi:hypothetical protein
MRKTSRVLAIGAVAVGLAGAGTISAYAAWSVPVDTLTVTAEAAEMPRGVTPRVAPRDGEAVVSWDAQELAPGTRMDHYVITAHHVGAPARPDITQTVAATGAATETHAFEASAVGGGRWFWTLVPRFASWSGAESAASAELSFPAAAATPSTGGAAQAGTGVAAPSSARVGSASSPSVGAGVAALSGDVPRPTAAEAGPDAPAAGPSGVTTGTPASGGGGQPASGGGQPGPGTGGQPTSGGGQPAPGTGGGQPALGAARPDPAPPALPAPSVGQPQTAPAPFAEQLDRAGAALTGRPVPAPAPLVAQPVPATGKAS